MASTEQKREIQVFADWLDSGEAVFMGTLTAIRSRGKEIFSFEYDKTWLSSSEQAQIIDPELQLYSGKQFPSQDKTNFGVFLDSSPDRWGRVLMKRREVAMARAENRPTKPLFETDFLLGVYDETRMGALRFKELPNNNFLNDNRDMAAPPWASLRQLEQASLKVEDEDMPNQNEYLKWLNLLIAPGSSLGGARPKASVTDTEGRLWIAKFPSKNDTKDMGAWEMVAHRLAQKSGVNVADTMLEKFTGRYHTFLSKRFDRTSTKRRIHFASAMTLLNKKDGETGSYLDMAAFIIRYGSNVERDLEELWRRIVFNVCISNTDDHLRNHGFLLTDTGWELSPAYDMNPNEYRGGLILNISEDDNSQDLSLVEEVAPYFRLQKEKVKMIIAQVQKAVRDWQKEADIYGISRTEQMEMKNAFLC